MMYAFSENYLLPLSHDEVVHGKRSLLMKMAGDDWQQCASLRLLLGYMYSHPGKKLLFMGGEFAQRREWTHDGSLDWHLLQEAPHAGVHRWVQDLNTLYRHEAALHELDCDPAGFEWVDASDRDQSTLTFLRRGRTTVDIFLIVCNFTPVVRHDYRVGVPRDGRWREILNSDSTIYGGSGQGNMGGVEAQPSPFHGRPYSLTMTFPPLAAVFFKNTSGT
jgi:1,4-alpha-glucan branching enzyme